MSDEVVSERLAPGANDSEGDLPSRPSATSPDDPLRRVLDRVPDGFLALDTDWRCVYVNARAAAMLGREPVALVGRRIWDELPDTMGERFHQELHDAMVTQEPTSFEQYHAPWHRWFEVRLYPTPDGLSAFFVETTDRHGADEGTREGEARFRMVADNSAMMLFHFDLVRGAVWRAGGLLTALGYGPGANRESLEWWMDHIHPDDRATSDRSFMSLLDGTHEAEESSFGYRFRRSDGAYVALTSRARVLRDAAGRVSGLTGVVTDTEDRHQVEDALRDSEARFRVLAAASPLGIFQSDLEGRISYVNPRILQIFEVTEEEGLGHGWIARLHPDDKPRVLATWITALEAGEDFMQEYRLRFDDGRERWVSGRSAPLRDASGAVVGSVGTIEDLTQRRRLEQQLLHSQKLEAVGQLSGGVAHDFNNLLTVIQANVDSARANAGEGVRAELDEAAAAAGRAAALTRQLLAFSRKQVLQPTALDLNAVVTASEPMFSRLLGERVQVDVVLEPRLWPARADAGQVEQVLMNLVLNARDAMPEGGTITVETTNSPADGPAGHDCVCLHVRDTGVGMDEETRARVFEPFFTTKPPGVGTGLGLAMVYGIVTQSDGTVQIESTPGAGATFTVSLPRARAAGPGAPAQGEGAAAPSPDPQPAAAAVPERILLVEDEAAVRGVARRILERAGYVVLEARHGADALLVWREHGGAVDMLLTDVRMPEMGGLELVALLRRERPDLPVVVMSGYADAGAPAETERFLEKPFSRESLLASVRQALDDAQRGGRPA